MFRWGLAARSSRPLSDPDGARNVCSWPNSAVRLKSADHRTIGNRVGPASSRRGARGDLADWGLGTLGIRAARAGPRWHRSCRVGHARRAGMAAAIGAGPRVPSCDSGASSHRGAARQGRGTAPESITRIGCVTRSKALKALQTEVPL